MPRSDSSMQTYQQIIMDFFPEENRNVPISVLAQLPEEEMQYQLNHAKDDEEKDDTTEDEKAYFEAFLEWLEVCMTFFHMIVPPF